MMSGKSKGSREKKTADLKKAESKKPNKMGKKGLSKPLVIWLSLVFLVSGTISIVGYNILNVSSPTFEKDKSSGPNIGGPFSATNHNGFDVTERDFLGKFLIVYFGYTYCPDICPTALTEISSAIDMIGNKGESVLPIFVTIDPERDTPEYLKEYISFFHPRMIGLSGTINQVSEIAKAYKVFFSKGEQDPNDPGNYLMDHSTLTYLIGKDGKYLDHFSHGVSAEEIVKKVREHL